MHGFCVKKHKLPHSIVFVYAVLRESVRGRQTVFCWAFALVLAEYKFRQEVPKNESKNYTCLYRV